MIGRPPERPNPLDCTDAICERLIAGESMRTICIDTDMPAQSMVYAMMAKDETFRSSIARAREMGQEAIIDGTVDLADEATVDNHQVIKLRIWARQWRASKIAPRKYGDKLAIGGDADSPLTIQHITRKIVDPKADE